MISPKRLKIGSSFIEKNYKKPKNIDYWAGFFFTKKELINEWIKHFNLKLTKMD